MDEGTATFRIKFDPSNDFGPIAVTAYVVPLYNIVFSILRLNSGRKIKNINYLG